MKKILFTLLSLSLITVVSCNKPPLTYSTTNLYWNGVEPFSAKLYESPYGYSTLKCDLDKAKYTNAFGMHILAINAIDEKTGKDFKVDINIPNGAPLNKTIIIEGYDIKNSASTDAFTFSFVRDAVQVMKNIHMSKSPDTKMFVKLTKNDNDYIEGYFNGVIGSTDFNTDSLLEIKNLVNNPLEINEGYFKVKK